MTKITASGGGPLTLAEYQQKSWETRVHRLSEISAREQATYMFLALCGEAGEAANRWKKVLRDRPEGKPTDRDCDELAAELGDCLWYLTRCAEAIDTTLVDVAWGNLLKVHRRHRTAQANAAAAAEDGGHFRAVAGVETVTVQPPPEPEKRAFGKRFEEYMHQEGWLCLTQGCGREPEPGADYCRECASTNTRR